MKIRIILKNGIQLPDLQCEGFTTETSRVDGSLIGYEYKGGLPPRPMYVGIDQIAAVIRLEDDDAEQKPGRET